VFHFTPFHGSWLNMVEIWFGILRMKCLKGRSFCSAENLIDTIVAFISTWNEHFAHPFDWKYTGEGLAEKVVCRLTDWLLLEKDGMTCKFIHKQFLLMTNLANDYWSQVPRKRWQTLLEALTRKGRYVNRVIDQDEKRQLVARAAKVALLNSLQSKLASVCSPKMAQAS
jgi:hypothetical protein